jgi:hypothetical protein
MAESTEALDNDTPKEKTPIGWQKHWSSQMDAAGKRLVLFRQQGNRINDRYLGVGVNASEGTEVNSNELGMFELNLFHTNIKTTTELMLGQSPKVDVSREHQDPNDDVARVASVMFQRMLDTTTAPSGTGLKSVLNSCLFDRLVPGIGVARVRYDFKAQVEMVLNPQTMVPEEIEKIVDEDAPTDYVHWQDFCWGWARNWKEMPWIAFRSWLTKEEAGIRFTPEQADKMTYADQMPSGDDKTNSIDDPDQKNSIQKAEVWEIWNKKDKKVYFWTKGISEILEVADDPLELNGFWPCPCPMAANLTTTKFIVYGQGQIRE